MHSPDDVTRHLARARIMSTTAPDMARYYLATLHDTASRDCAIHRKYNRGDYQRQRDLEAAERAAAEYVSERHGGWAGPFLATPDVEPLIRPLPLTEPLYHHRVSPESSPFYGVYVGAHDRTDQRRGWWVEAQILPESYDASQHCLSRRVETREEAVTLAGRWAALGMAVVEAEAALVAQETVGQ
jgi:hypothetical protein